MCLFEMRGSRSDMSTSTFAIIAFSPMDNNNIQSRSGEQGVMMEASTSPQLLSDIEIDRNNKERSLNVAKQTIDVVGNLILNADRILGDLEKNNLLGEAIVRRCQEMADAIGHLAKELEDKNADDRKALAQACLQDVSSSSPMPATALTEDEVVDALDGAHGLLRDVEETLRSIERQEADEIADVALTVARIFLISIKNAYTTVTHHNNSNNSSSNNNNHMIEAAPNPEHTTVPVTQERALDFNVTQFLDNGVSSAGGQPTNHGTSAPVTQERGLDFNVTQFLDKGVSSAAASQPTNDSTRAIFDMTNNPSELLHMATDANGVLQMANNANHILQGAAGNGILPITPNAQDIGTYIAIGQQMNMEVNGTDRIRVLWPPLGPAVMSACNWGKDEAAKKPLLAVALGLTLWPAAVMTACVGTPVVLADTAIQSVYNALSGGPVVQTVERGAAQAYHAGRLTVLCGGLVARQSLRIAKRQVKRQGGVGKVAQNVAGMALDRVLHPVQTAQMTWQGIQAGAGAIKDAASFVHDAVEREKEKGKAATIL